MKIVKRIILFIFMFISLASCEDACGTVGFTYIQIANNSSQAIDAGVFWGTEGYYQVIPPQGTATYNVTDPLYTVKAKPVSDWLVFAAQKRDELIKAVKQEENNQDSTTPGDNQRLSQLSADLRQINTEIASFRAQRSTYKTCQGYIDTYVTGTLVFSVHDGETAHSISMPCESNGGAEN